jgi:hypothetical protein
MKCWSSRGLRIPGQELTLARRRGVARTTVDVIGEVKDDHGATLQKVRDRLEITLTDDEAHQLATGPMQYENGVHPPSRTVCHQAPGARCDNRTNRDLPGELSPT